MTHGWLYICCRRINFSVFLTTSALANTNAMAEWKKSEPQTVLHETNKLKGSRNVCVCVSECNKNGQRFKLNLMHLTAYDSKVPIMSLTHIRRWRGDKIRMSCNDGAHGASMNENWTIKWTAHSNNHTPGSVERNCVFSATVKSDVISVNDCWPPYVHCFWLCESTKFHLGHVYVSCSCERFYPIDKRSKCDSRRLSSGIDFRFFSSSKHAVDICVLELGLLWASDFIEPLHVLRWIWRISRDM